MVKKLWEIIKTPFVWVKAKWNQFEAWVATWAPGVKTRMVAGLGTLGSVAALMQEYISGLPLDKFISATSITIIGMVLFTMAFWFRGLSNRFV